MSSIVTGPDGTGRARGLPRPSWSAVLPVAGADVPVTTDVDEAADELCALLAHGRTVVLSGAGLSTESGIPDYRGPTGLARAATPMTYQEFTGSAAARRRYWARSYAGRDVMLRARPNAGHLAVAGLERLGLLDAVVTQNVDGLHRAAGSRRVEELHGSLGTVVCLGCGARSGRDALQRRLAEANPGFDAGLFDGADGDTAAVRPDGDLALAEAMVERFVTVPCEACGDGPLKPDVVYFGETVPAGRVARCYALVDAAHTLLVLGSSLAVMSGYRFVRHTVRRGITVAVVNQGPTRADGDADLRVDAALGAVLPEVARRSGV